MAYVIFFVAILPGLLICRYIYNLDKYEREPRWLMVKCFVLGMLSTAPALVVQLSLKSHERHGDFLGELFFAFAIVAVSEECSKFFFLRWYAYGKKDFNEPMDGIVYSVMIGMGFATLENVLYAFQSGIGTAAGRALTAVPAHAAFAVVMGAFVGMAKFITGGRRIIYQLAGLSLAIVLHGAYDFFLMQDSYDGLIFLAVGVLVFALFLSRWLIRHNEALSPFKGEQ